MKNIHLFPGYFVDRNGVIYSTWSRGPNAKPYERPPLALVPSIRSGYYGITLRQDGERRSLLVHRVVAIAFHGVPNEGQEVSHLNGDPLDNRACNLTWETHSQNMQRRKAYSGVKPLGRPNNRKLTDKQVYEAKARIASGQKNKDIAVILGVSPSAISRIKSGHRWSG